MIATYAGDISAKQLGFTLMHEHVFVRNTELLTDYPGQFDRNAAVEAAVTKLAQLKELGVDSVVDLTVFGLGRDASLVAEVAARSNINLIAATGWYTFADAPTFASLGGPGRLFGGEDRLVELFTRELADGIGDTGVRAAALKCATDHHGFTAGVQNVMHAVAAAHAQTGAPILTHSDSGTQNGMGQVGFFRARGVDLSRVVIGHVGDSSDLDYLRRLTDSGVTLGMDRFGLESKSDLATRTDIVAELCRRGYASQIVLSTDSSIVSMNFPPAQKAIHMAGWDATLVPQEVVPGLRSRGVSHADITAMTVDNPARILCRRSSVAA